MSVRCKSGHCRDDVFASGRVGSIFLELISSAAKSPRGPSNDGCLPRCPKKPSTIATSNLGGIGHLPPMKRREFSGLPSNPETNAGLLRNVPRLSIARGHLWSEVSQTVAFSIFENTLKPL
jgi:hypothetical protein